MIDTLDSRALRRNDCYGQRFMRTGRFRYAVEPAGASRVVFERPFEVNVVGRTSTDTAMRQHTVTVTTDGKHFTPDTETMTVEEGDLVLWACPEATTAYAVVGEKDFFASAMLVNECGFAHTFLAPGDYHWRDAFGSELAGVVQVSDPKVSNQREFNAWRNQLGQGALVMISGTKAEPESLEVLTGQSVYFAIVKGPGVSITDERLLGRFDHDEPAPPPTRKRATTNSAKKARTRTK